MAKQKFKRELIGAFMSSNGGPVLVTCCWSTDKGLIDWRKECEKDGLNLAYISIDELISEFHEMTLRAIKFNRTSEVLKNEIGSSH